MVSRPQEDRFSFESEILNRYTYSLLPSQPHHLPSHDQIHQPQANRFVNHIPFLQPIQQAGVGVLQGALGARGHIGLFQHEQLADLDELVGSHGGLDDLAGFLEGAVERVDNQHALGARVFVVREVMLVVVAAAGGFGLDLYADDVRVQLDHVRGVGADGGDVAAFAAAFVGGEELGREERRGGRRGAEDDVGVADFFLEEAAVFAEFGREGAEFDVAPGRVALRDEGLHELCAACEAAVDDVDVVDVFGAEEECEPNVPVCLLTRAEDGDGRD